MDQADLVALLRDGVTAKGGRWADLGAGEGAFTLALADLLGPGGQITAVDREAGSLKRLVRGMLKQAPSTLIDTMVADFTRPLRLSGLDGVVMANSLHFVKDKAPVLESVCEMLRPGGTLIVVEYDTDKGNGWVPHPFSFATWHGMAAAAGLEDTHRLATYPSRYFGSMYSAASIRPLASSSVT